MSVAFRSMRYDDFYNELPYPRDPQDLNCRICLENFTSDAILDAHEGRGTTRHILHRSCLQKDIERQSNIGRLMAKCITCSKDILNTKHYLPWRCKIIKTVREFANQYKGVAGAALGAISVFGGISLAGIGGLTADTHSESMSYSERVKLLPAFMGATLSSMIPLVLGMPYLGSRVCCSNRFLAGIGASAIAAMAAKGIGENVLLPVFTATMGTVLGVVQASINRALGDFA